MLRFEAEGGGRGSGDLPRNCTPEPLCAGTCAQGFGGLEFWGVGSARRGPSSVMPPRSEPSLYAQLPCGGGGRGLCTGPAQFQRLRGEGGRGPNLRADLQGRFLQGVVCNYFICVVPQ